MRTKFRRTQGWMAGAAVVLAAACSGATSQDPVSPSLEIVPGDFNLGVYVCKIANDAETIGDVFTFNTQADGGNVVGPQVTSTATLIDDPNKDCKLVWTRANTSLDDETNITIEELVPPGYHLDRISFTGDGNPAHVPDAIENPASPSVTFKPFAGLNVYFKNSFVGGGGCSLTPGYWKTHSSYGPAGRNDTWDEIDPDGENSDFFLSGHTYYQVLWTTPQGGNAYYILAHAYIAAELNFLNGSDPSAAQAAFNAATALFNAYTPAQVGVLKGNNATRQAFLSNAAVLDNYNNGLIGPGHCD